MNVVEWTINNFSYWNEHVHEKQIECSGSDFTYCPRILLYPRGLSGCEEHLVVHVHYASSDECSVLSGKLSCVDSTGSLCCALNIDEKVMTGDYYELLPKLKFKDIAAKIRKSENTQQDRFTLRLELRWKTDREYRMCTTIDVFDSYVKIDPTKYNYMDMCCISTIHYPFDKCEERIGIYLSSEKTKFFMQPTSFKKNFLVSTFLSVLKFDSVTRTEKNENVFQDQEKWTFVNSLTAEEMMEEGFSLLLKIKIAPSNSFKNYYDCYTGFNKAVKVSPTNDLPLSEGSNPTTSNERENSVTVLLNELMCLYQDHDFSDFQLRCGEVTIPTHRSILSARSPVLKAMLLSDMAESASRSMDIADLDVHTLGRFLVFLYTGAADGLEWEGALKLYYAADKYQVPSLKRECRSVFQRNVSVSKVCDILSLADKHQDQELTKEAHDFILRNYNDVLRSEGWQTFMNNEPLLALRTLTNFGKENSFKVIPES